MTIQRHNVGKRLSEIVVHNGTVYLAGEFTPAPGEFTCSGCPALDVVCAGTRLRAAPEHLVAAV